MSDLVEFLRARLDERERSTSWRKTRQVRGEPCPKCGLPISSWGVSVAVGDVERVAWISHEFGTMNCELPFDEWRRFADDGPTDQMKFDHADIDVKRRIIDEYVSAARSEYTGSETAAEFILEPIIRLLALPYADHPDYRDEWRP